MADLNDKVFIVTGATGSLGQVVARTLWGAGAKLALVDRTAESRFQEVFPDMVDSPACSFAHDTDLTQEEAVAEMVAHVLQRYGRIDGLVNIAGGFHSGEPVHETPLEVWDKMLGINALTTFLTSRAVLPHMIEQGYGKVVNIGGRVALEGKKNMAAYSVGKTAVLRLTESMSAEVKGHGVNVNCILPGTIDTPANRQAMPNADFSRWVQPEALADVILFLVSDAARAIHGAAIPVYGLT